MAGGALQEEVVASSPLTISGVEEGVPSEEVAEEIEQVSKLVKDTKFAQASIHSVAQEPGATQTLVVEDPMSHQRKGFLLPWDQICNWTIK